MYYLLLKSLDDIQKKENFMKLGIENRSILEFEKKFGAKGRSRQEEGT